MVNGKFYAWEINYEYLVKKFRCLNIKELKYFYFNFRIYRQIDKLFYNYKSSTYVEFLRSKNNF